MSLSSAIGDRFPVVGYWFAVVGDELRCRDGGYRNLLVFSVWDACRKMVSDSCANAQQTSRVKRCATITDARHNTFQRRRYLSSSIERQTLMVVGYRGGTIGDITARCERYALVYARHRSGLKRGTASDGCLK
jgi:hypothetical protein